MKGQWLGCGVCDICCSDSLSDCNFPTFIAAGTPVVVTRRSGVEVDNGYGVDEIEFHTEVYGVFSCVEVAWKKALETPAMDKASGYVCDEFLVRTFEVDGELGTELVLVKKLSLCYD